MEKIIPSHLIGTWLLGIIHKVLDFFGLEHSKGIEEWTYIIVILAISLGIGWCIKEIFILGLRKLVSMRHNPIGEDLLKRRVISRCSHFIPPLVFLAFIPIAFNSGNRLLAIIERIAGAYTVVAFGIGLAAIGSFIFYTYNKRENSKNLPIKGILNISLGVIWIVITIIAISILVDKSPAYLLTGLGAFAAALMLIFKDSILGFVAGIQMSQNDMLHVGGWIVVPGTPANGIVLDVTLSAVKVQNFDNTFVTVPPYTLVSTSFQNYRGMQASGARRFTRTLVVDTPSVVKLSDEILDKALAAHPEIKPFVTNLQSTHKEIEADKGIRPLNGSIETNLGLFRAYCAYYLLNSPWVNPSMQVLVRILEPTIYGIPLDIYAFAITTHWNSYEAIQSAIMEHFAVCAPDFGLDIYTAGSMTVEQAGTPGLPEPAASPNAPSAPTSR